MEKNKHLPFIAINVYHRMPLRNADPDLNEYSGGSTDLGQKKHGSAVFHTPIHPLLERCWTVLDQVQKWSNFCCNIFGFCMLCSFSQLLHNISQHDPTILRDVAMKCCVRLTGP